jgi:TolA-binding protein
MKKLILLISFLTLSWNTFSQTATTQPSKETKTDSTQVCLPTPIARQVAKDLIRLDGCKEEIKLLESKVISLQDIAKVKDVMLKLHEDKDKNNQTTIKLLEKQVGEYDNLSNDLNKELKGYKVKTFLWKVGTFVGILTTSYLLLK